MVEEGEIESIEAGGAEEGLRVEVNKRRPISVMETVGHSASLGFIPGTCFSLGWLLTKVGGSSNAKLAKMAVSHVAVSIQTGGQQLRWLMA